MKVENWGITRDTLGTLRLLSAWDVDSNAVILRAKNEVGSAIPLQVSGYYQPLTDQVNVDIQLSEIGLDRLGRYASDYFTESKGGISGRIRISGPSAHPDFSGRLFLDSVYLHLRDMNTSFFMNDSIYIDRSDFILKDFVVKDIPVSYTHLEVLTVVNFPTESATNWKDVFEDLKERGVSVVDLLVCDGLSGIENALADTFPKADLQLCTVHLKRNIAGKVKPRDKKQVMEELKQICAPDPVSYTHLDVYKRQHIN